MFTRPRLQAVSETQLPLPWQPDALLPLCNITLVLLELFPKVSGGSLSGGYFDLTSRLQNSGQRSQAGRAS